MICSRKSVFNLALMSALMLKSVTSHAGAFDYATISVESGNSAIRNNMLVGLGFIGMQWLSNAFFSSKAYQFDRSPFQHQSAMPPPEPRATFICLVPKFKPTPVSQHVLDLMKDTSYFALEVQKACRHLASHVQEVTRHTRNRAIVTAPLPEGGKGLTPVGSSIEYSLNYFDYYSRELGKRESVIDYYALSSDTYSLSRGVSRDHSEAAYVYKFNTLNGKADTRYIDGFVSARCPEGQVCMAVFESSGVNEFDSFEHFHSTWYDSQKTPLDQLWHHIAQSAEGRFNPADQDYCVDELEAVLSEVYLHKDVLNYLQKGELNYLRSNLPPEEPMAYLRMFIADYYLHNLDIKNVYEEGAN